MSFEGNANADVIRAGALTKYATIALIIYSVICILLGVYCRCDALNRKYLWFDEIITQMFVSNHLRPLSMGKLYTRPEVLDSVQIDKTSSALGLIKTIRSHNPEQAPLYFVADHFFCRLVGGDPKSKIRILAIICGILVIPVSYFFSSSWLSSKLAGLITAAMIAISPFCLEMSLQAKPYSLWALLCFTTVMALSKALHKPTVKHWVLYLFSLLACLYTHVWSLLFVGAISVVVAARKNVKAIAFKDRRVPIGFVVSTVIALLLFYPWVSDGYPSENLTWLKRSTSGRAHLTQSFKMLVACFCEFCQDPSHILSLLVVVAIAASVAIFVVKSERSKSIPLIMFIAVYMPAIVALDFLFHKSFAASNRYFTPCFLALWVMLGGANLVWNRPSATWEKLLVFTSTFVILGVATFSSLSFSSTRTLGNERELPGMLQAHDGTVIFVTGKGSEDVQNTLYVLAYRPLDNATRFVGIDTDDKNSHIPVENFEDSYIFDQRANKLSHYRREQMISQCDIIVR